MADLRIVVASLRCDEYAVVVTRIDATVFAIAVTVGTDGSASGDVIDDDAVFIVAFVGRTIDARFPLELVIARNDGCAVAFGLAGFALWRGLGIGIGVGIGIGIGIGVGIGIDLRFGFALGDAVDEFANFGFGVAMLRNGVFAVVVASEHVEIGIVAFRRSLGAFGGGGLIGFFDAFGIGPVGLARHVFGRTVGRSDVFAGDVAHDDDIAFARLCAIFAFIGRLIRLRGVGRIV